MIHFTCNECGTAFDVPDDERGKKTKCPKCEALILVPDAPRPTELASAPEAQASSPSNGVSERVSPAASPVWRNRLFGFRTMFVAAVVGVLAVVGVVFLWLLPAREQAASAKIELKEDKDRGLPEAALRDNDRDVRRAAVEKLTDQAALAKVALEAADSDVRRAAVGKLTDHSALLRLAEEADDVELRAYARYRLRRLIEEKRKRN